MSSPSDATFVDRVFHQGRTHSAFLDRPVTDDTLRELYALTRLGPTSANSNPARFVFVRTAAGKERLRPAMFPGNLDKTMIAPVTAIVAYDTQFHTKMAELFPVRPEMGANLAKMSAPAMDTFLVQNASLSAGYLILAARTLGLDAGPMGGFDKAKVDEAFFADGRWKSSLLINLGYGDTTKLFPRLPRLAFEDAVQLA